MPNDPTEVQPGDLITANLWNALVRKVNALQPSAGGTVPVPNLFNRALADAKAIIQLAGSQLNLSQVIDAFGLTVDPNDAANAQRRVLSQIPLGGTFVAPQTGVSLVVAAVGSGGGASTVPSITDISPSTQQATLFINITGANFDTPATNNTVLFDGTPSTPDVGTASGLHVRVPPNIPGVPPVGGSRSNVPVVVQNHFGQRSAPRTMTVQSPPPVPPPSITTVVPQGGGPTGLLGQPVIITGSGFGDSLTAVRVFFDGHPDGGVQPSSGGPTTLTVTPPLSIGTGGSGSTHSYLCTVQVSGVASNAVAIVLMVP